LPTTESAKKRLRQADKRRVRNRVYRTRARTLIKKTNKLISAGKLDEAADSAASAARALDKAAQKGVVHEKNAARRKSRLLRRLGRAQAQSANQ
jgi:small subunit ribosomal protein S20